MYWSYNGLKLDFLMFLSDTQDASVKAMWTNLWNVECENMSQKCHWFLPQFNHYSNIYANCILKLLIVSALREGIFITNSDHSTNILLDCAYSGHFLNNKNYLQLIAGLVKTNICVIKTNLKLFKITCSDCSCFRGPGHGGRSF